MDLDLGRDHVGPQQPWPSRIAGRGHDRGGGFITGGFNAQDNHLSFEFGDLVKW
jgi:hypothetical protein